MDKPVTLDEVAALAQQLTPLDKVRLIEQLTPAIKQTLVQSTAPRRSLRGLWRGLDLRLEDIDAARREMWRTFPREVA